MNTDKPSSPTMREVLSVRLPRQTWLSPDGRMVVHSETRADWEHNVIRHRIILTDLVQQKQMWQIDDIFASQIKWTCDSKSIGYITSCEGRSVLRKIDCADGVAVDVACGADRFTDFDWHPSSLKAVIAEDTETQNDLDNELFSVQGEPPPSARLAIADIESGETQHFEGWDHVYGVSDLSWSPSASKVLFTAIPEPDNKSQWQHLLMLDLATGRLVRLIEGKRAIFFPVWNDDGSQYRFF